MMTIPVPTDSVLKFDMNAAVIRTLEEKEITKHCDNCDKKDAYQKLEITDTKQFLMLQLKLFEGIG